MFELALHILDLVQNAIEADASVITILIELQTASDELSIAIEDDGCGMDEALLSRVTSPFVTTRATRTIGLGIPLFRQCAEACGGSFNLASQKGVGTKIRATFQASHLDLPPMGDLTGTLIALIAGHPERPEFVFRHSTDGRMFELDTREVRKALGGLPLLSAEVLSWLRKTIDEGIAESGRIASPE